MPRLRTDQACLEAQLQAQVAQRLTAELAVSCPDCGVEPGRACRDSFDRAVKSHLGRVVGLARAPIGERRDTEPCPAPSESLERASARAFAENLRSIVDRGWEDFVAKYAAGAIQTSTAPDDSAPSPAASAPVAVASTQPTAFPVEECGGCSRPLESGAKKFGELFGPPLCGDCAAERVRAGKPAPLHKRIAETKSDDAPQCAWSTPTSEGEGWR